MVDWVMHSRGEVSWITFPGTEASGLTLAFTTRKGGASRGRYAGLNLSPKDGTASARRQNMASVADALKLPAAPLFPVQKHTADLSVVGFLPRRRPVADGLLTNVPGLPLGVVVADCAPVVLWNPTARAVAVLHCGWRGVVAGIIEAAAVEMARRFGAGPLHAYVGPAIGMCCYVVGLDVAEAVAGSGDNPLLGSHFASDSQGLLRFDLAGHVRDRLALVGVPPDNIEVVELCTSCESELFYSYRRDGVTGRCAAIAMIR